MGKIVIFGSSGHARVIIDMIEKEGRHTITGLIDSYRQPGETTLGYPVLGSEDDLKALWARHEIDGVVVGVGDNYWRGVVADKVRGICPDIPLLSVIHPSAAIGREVFVGAGAVIMAGATVNPCCTIGDLCIINTRASLDHDSRMRRAASLAPGAVTGGGCEIGECSAISIGATVIHGIKIGAHTVIGAGAVVLRDIESHKIAYGSPARVIRSREPGEKYL